MDRVTQCKDCHNDPDSFGHTGYSWYSFIDGYGMFKNGTDPATVGAPYVHIGHIRNYGNCVTECHFDGTGGSQNPISLTCNTCHEFVDHSSHGSTSLTYTCENALCHKKTIQIIREEIGTKDEDGYWPATFIFNITQTPACDNCHDGHDDITASHTFDDSSLKLDCIDCHPTPYLPDLHNAYAFDNGFATNCSVCHDSTSTTVLTAIDSDNINCDSCHTSPHGDISGIHTTTTGTGCMNCHFSENVIGTHSDDGCFTTCHDKELIPTLPDSVECNECHGGGTLFPAHKNRESPPSSHNELTDMSGRWSR